MTEQQSLNLRELVDGGRFDEAVTRYVKQEDVVSFPRLKQAFSPYMPVDGDGVIEASDCHNLIYWAGLSEKLTAILRRLSRHGLIYYQVTSRSTYHAEGHPLNLPIAHRVRAYAKPHWLPVLLRSGPVASLPSGRRRAQAPGERG